MKLTFIQRENAHLDHCFGINYDLRLQKALALPLPSKVTRRAEGWTLLGPALSQLLPPRLLSLFTPIVQQYPPQFGSLDQLGELVILINLGQ